MDNKKTPKTDGNQGNEKTSSSHCQIDHLIGVMSAKGGVGKSLVTSVLAVELTRQGYQVGILDADFTRSSIPMLFGVQGPARTGEYSFIPPQSRLGIKIISTNLLFANQDQQVIWKEQLIGKVIDELYKEVEWDSLDFLLVDMPAATSEVAVAILQTLPFSGAVIVTTPQVLVTRIAHKTIATIQKIGVRIVGVVENMVFYLDPDSGKKHFIFGQSQAQSVASNAKAPILTQIPLDPDIARSCDQGKVEEIVLEDGPEVIESFLESLKIIEEEGPSIQLDSGNEVFSFPVVPHTQTGFSDTVIQLIQRKENMGVLENPNAQGHFLGSCGDSMQIDLRLSDKMIMEAKFLADGCGATIACGSMITKMAITKTLDEAKKIAPDDLLLALDGLPEDHLHCAELAVMALREAVVDAIEGHGSLKK